MAAKFEIFKSNPEISGSTSKRPMGRKSRAARGTSRRPQPRRGIESVKTNAAAAKVEDHTEHEHA